MKKLFAILFLTVFFVSFGAGYFLQPPVANACWCQWLELTCTPRCETAEPCDGGGTCVCNPQTYGCCCFFT